MFDKINDRKILYKLDQESMMVLKKLIPSFSEIGSLLLPHDENAIRKLRYYFGELFGEGKYFPEPETVIERIRAIVYLNLLLGTSDDSDIDESASTTLSLNNFKKILSEDNERDGTLTPSLLKNLRSEIYLQSSKPITLEEDSYFQADLYNYVAPRLVETILNILFHRIPNKIILLINLDEYKEEINLHEMKLAFVSVIAGTGSIVCSVKTNPSIDSKYLNHVIEIPSLNENMIPYRIYLFYREEEDIFSSQLRNRDRIIDGVLSIIVDWLIHLVRGRQEIAIHENFTSIVRINHEARIARLENFLNWLIENGRRIGKSWDFAVSLKPSDDNAPRHTVKLSTIACSNDGPYRKNPQTLKYGEGISTHAYATSHIKESHLGQIVEPIAFERDVKSSIAVPTVTGDKVNGVLYVASRKAIIDNKPYFDDVDKMLLALLGQISGEILSNSQVHRDIVESNFNQLIENPLVVSPILSNFFAQQDLEHDIYQILNQKADIKFVVIAFDMYQSQKILQDNKELFNNQVQVDRFFQWLGVHHISSTVNEIIASDPILNIPINRIYQLKADRFVLIRYFLDIKDMEYQLNEIDRLLHIAIRYTPENISSQLSQITDFHIMIGAILVDMKNESRQISQIVNQIIKMIDRSLDISSLNYSDKSIYDKHSHLTLIQIP
jgi:hypothetical protein